MKKFNFKSYFAGVISTVLVIALILSVGAATITKTLNATYKDIKISVNGTAITPKDATGKTIEPFIVDGSTYLPVRAVADAVGYDVEWDGVTSTVKLTNKSDSQSKVETSNTETEPQVAPTTESAKSKLAFRNSDEIKTYIKENYKEFTYTSQTTDGLDTIEKNHTVKIESVDVYWETPEKISWIKIECDSELRWLKSYDAGKIAAKDYMKIIADDLISKLPGIRIAESCFVYSWYDYPSIRSGFNMVQCCTWRTVNGEFGWYPLFDSWK